MHEELVDALRRIRVRVKNDQELARQVPPYLIGAAADAIEELGNAQEQRIEQERKALLKSIHRWIPVAERLPECDLGAEVGNIEWISCGMVFAGCFGRGGKYRDEYFRTWTDAGEGMDAKDADYWRAVTLPETPKEE